MIYKSETCYIIKSTYGVDASVAIALNQFAQYALLATCKIALQLSSSNKSYKLQWLVQTKKLAE